MSRVRVAIMIAAALSAGGCGILKKAKPKTPTLGERIPVLTTELDVVVDDATAALPMELPAAAANTEWAESGGNAAKSMEHLALGNDLGEAFWGSIGEGSNLKARLASSPVIADGRVYTIDTAPPFAPSTPGRAGKFGPPSSARKRAIAPRFSAAALLMPAAGSSPPMALALRQRSMPATAGSSGGRPGGPLRGQPTIAGENIYIISQDRPELYSLNDRRHAKLVERRGAGNRRRVRLGRPGFLAGHGRRWLLVRWN